MSILREINSVQGDSKPLVGLEQITKIYPNGTEALRNVNTTIYEGEFISVVGPSGCGKSTIFQIIAGLEKQTKGKVKIFNQAAKDTKIGSDIAFVFQDASLMPWSSVAKNIGLPLRLKGIPKKQIYKEVERVLELVGLSGYGDHLPSHLSGGMKMRVSIARALISRPKLLLMDEPFGALDEITRQKLQNELMSIWEKEENMTVLFITHNVFEAVFLSTRILVMTPGPGKIEDIYKVQVPFPREEVFRTTSKFSDLVSKVGKSLKH